jgi:hypothetical protein
VVNNPVGDLLTEHLSDAEKTRYRRTRWLVIATMLLVTAAVVAAAILMARGS